MAHLASVRVAVAGTQPMRWMSFHVGAMNWARPTAPAGDTASARKDDSCLNCASSHSYRHGPPHLGHQRCTAWRTSST